MSRCRTLSHPSRGHHTYLLGEQRDPRRRMPHEQADRLIEGTAEVSPMADNSFDSVVSQFGLMFLRDRATAQAGAVTQKKCRLCTKMSFGGAVAQRPFCYEE